MTIKKLPGAPEARAHAGVTSQISPRALDRWNPGICASAAEDDDARSISVYDVIGYDYWTGDGVTAKRIAAALPDITLVANMVETGKTPLLTPGELAELGFTLIVSPLSLLFSAVKAMQDSLAILRDEGSLRNRLDRLVDFQGFGDLVGLPEHYELEQRYR